MKIHLSSLKARSLAIVLTLAVTSAIGGRGLYHAWSSSDRYNKSVDARAADDATQTRKPHAAARSGVSSARSGVSSRGVMDHGVGQQFLTQVQISGDPGPTSFQQYAADLDTGEDGSWRSASQSDEVLRQQAAGDGCPEKPCSGDGVDPTMASMASIAGMRSFVGGNGVSATATSGNGAPRTLGVGIDGGRVSDTPADDRSSAPAYVTPPVTGSFGGGNGRSNPLDDDAGTHTGTNAAEKRGAVHSNGVSDAPTSGTGRPVDQPLHTQGEEGSERVQRVPEPATLTLIVLGGALAAWHQRCRGRKAR